MFLGTVQGQPLPLAQDSRILVKTLPTLPSFVELWLSLTGVREAWKRNSFCIQNIFMKYTFPRRSATLSRKDLKIKPTTRCYFSLWVNNQQFYERLPARF